MAGKLKLKKGDKVVVITGREKGKKGEIMLMLRAEHRAVVAGVNMIKRHTRQSPGEPGGIIEKEAAIHISNIAHLDPTSQKPTRVGFKFLDDGRKVRFAKRSGEVLDR